MRTLRFVEWISGSLLVLTLFVAATKADAACPIPPAGSVLVAGGFGQNLFLTRKAEFFNPNTGTFIVGCNMNTPRAGAVSIVFPDGPLAGRVLIAGGRNDVSTSEILVPSSGIFWPGPMLLGQAEFTTGVLLGNGKVLIPKGEVDGAAGEYPIRAATIFVPATKLFWNLENRMNVPRLDFTATLLQDGRVLIAGGYTGKLVGQQFTVPTKTAELYHPVTKTFTLTGNMSIPRALASATLLNDGRVLIAGGATTGNLGTKTAELYDPTTGTFTPTGDMTVERDSHTATLLPAGGVLLAGGDFLSTNKNTAEIFHPLLGTFSPTTGQMSGSGRYNHTATLISGSGTALDGQVLLAGGFDDAHTTKPLNTADIYNPATGLFTQTQNMNFYHGLPTSALIP